jgi:hypothetical protein
MGKSFLFLSIIILFASASFGQTKAISSEFAKVQKESLGYLSKLKNSTTRLEKVNKELETRLSQLKELDVQKWSDAFLNLTSVIPPQEAEKKFERPQNGIEKILAAQIIRLQSKIKSVPPSETTQNAIRYIENEVDPAFHQFLSSLTVTQRAYAVKDNPLAFGNEIEFLAQKKAADENCTAEEFSGAFKDFNARDIKKNAFLFSSPYYIYQNRYLPAYNTRLLELAQDWKNEKASVVKTLLTAHLVSSNHHGLQKMNQELLQQHETQVRTLLGKDLTSQEIEAFERRLAERSPKCFGSAMAPSTKVMKFIMKL